MPDWQPSGKSGRKKVVTDIVTSCRNHELELEAAKLRAKVMESDDPSHLEVTRREVNKVMSELKEKMQIQFESQNNTDKENRTKELMQLDETRRKVVCFKKRKNNFFVSFIEILRKMPT